MKTLINKKDPKIRISSDNFEEQELNNEYYISYNDRYDSIDFPQSDWEMVETDPKDLELEILKTKMDTCDVFMKHLNKTWELKDVLDLVDETARKFYKIGRGGLDD